MSNCNRFLPQAAVVLFCALLLAPQAAGSAPEPVSGGYDDGGRRNPFIALVTSDGRLLVEIEEESFRLVVEGIITDDDADAYALVTGTVVRVGDVVGGYEVVGINRNAVTFTKDGETIAVELMREEER